MGVRPFLLLLHLARKYAAVVAVLAVALALFPVTHYEVPLGEAAPRALFWGGFAAAAVLYLDLRRRKQWPLYDNLRVPRGLLLAGLVALNLATTLLLWLILQ